MLQQPALAPRSLHLCKRVAWGVGVGVSEALLFPERASRCIFAGLLSAASTLQALTKAHLPALESAPPRCLGVPERAQADTLRHPAVALLAEAKRATPSHVRVPTALQLS